MNQRLALLGMPIRLPFEREDFHGMLARATIAMPNRPSLQCTIGEVLNMELGMFLDLMETLDDVTPREK